MSKMETKIRNLIEKCGQFDGCFKEKFLNNPIRIGKKDAVRVLIVDDEVMVHLLGEDDETDFMPFWKLAEHYRYFIYCDLFQWYQPMSLVEFLVGIGTTLQAGDKMVVSTKIVNDDCYRVFVIYDVEDHLIGEYDEKYELYFTNKTDEKD